MKRLIKYGTKNLLKVIPNSINRYVPHGLEFCLDLKKLPVDYHPKVIFDVGAHIGQSALRFKSWFPESEVHCFEPVKSTFDELRENTKRLKDVHYHHFGLSNQSGTGLLNILKDSSMNTLKLNDSDKDVKVGEASIDLKSIDEIIVELEVDHIDLLKIDTEGTDLDVLHGATISLLEKKISFIQIESGMNPFNDRHVPFYEFKDMMGSK